MKRHEFDPISAVFGLLFVILGLRFLTGEVTLAELDFNWLWPVAAVALGLALLFTARRPDERQSKDTDPSEGKGPGGGSAG